MKKFLSELWLIYVETAKAKKAMRILKKQDWSVDFLVSLLHRAAKIKKLDVHFIVTNKDGTSLRIMANAPVEMNYTEREKGLDVLATSKGVEAIIEAAMLEEGML